jgi:hypothetical protein
MEEKGDHPESWSNPVYLSTYLPDCHVGIARSLQIDGQRCFPPSLCANLTRCPSFCSLCHPICPISSSARHPPLLQVPCSTLCNITGEGIQDIVAVRGNSTLEVLRQEGDTLHSLHLSDTFSVLRCIHVSNGRRGHSLVQLCLFHERLPLPLCPGRTLSP